jgi:hypothetical protein
MRSKTDLDRYRMAKSKKDGVLPSLRAPSALIERVRKICANAGVDIASLRRQFWIDLVQTIESGEEIALPPHVMTVREKEIVQKAVSQNNTRPHTKSLDH